MLDIRLIRENPELVRRAIEAKRSEDVVDQVLELDRERRAIIGEVETLKSRRNTVTEEIAKLKMPDLNAGSVEAAMRTIEGTARSAGITVSE